MMSPPDAEAPHDGVPILPNRGLRSVRTAVRRFAVLLAVVCIASAVPAVALAADDTWPPLHIEGESHDPHTIVRGPGYYFSTAKIVLSLAVFLAWVKAADWISRDAVEQRQQVTLWNSVALGAFGLAQLLFWVVPFLLGFPLLILGLAGPLAAYVTVRNKAVDDDEDKVFTPDHLRSIFNRKFRGATARSEAAKDAKAAAAAIELTPRGERPKVEAQAMLIASRQHPGWDATRALLADVVAHRGEILMLDYTPEAVAVQYQIDGLWHAAAGQERATGDAILEVLKRISGLDPANRVKKQAGVFDLQVGPGKYICRLVSQGTPTGERAVCKVTDVGRKFTNLASLGMRDKLREQLLAEMGKPQGLILVSSLPAGGLSTLTRSLLEENDRLTRNFAAIEDARDPEFNLLNVEGFPYDSAAGQSPLEAVAAANRSYPDVLVVRDVVDGEFFKALCDQVKQERLVIAGLRAKDAVESLLRVLALKVPGKELATATTAVVSCRLIRKLCPGCRVAFAPTPEMLAKAGLPAGRVQTLYREPAAGEQETPCTQCGGIGYLGRTGIFEVLLVNDAVRLSLVQAPKVETVRAAARAAKMTTFQQEGLLLVAGGATSLTELIRVLKQ